MEGESLVIYFAISGAAMLLLFAVIAWQRFRLSFLEQRLTDASKSLAKKAPAPPIGLSLPLIDQAPFPLCYADNQGTIIRSSKAFAALTPKPAGTLSAFSKQTGAQLMSKKAHTRHERIALTTTKDTPLRHFSLVTWPVLSKGGSTGTVYALLEHTSHVRHAQAEHHFDQELLAIQDELLKDLAGTPQGTNPLVTELTELHTFLQNQRSAHPQRTMEPFDLMRVLGEILEEHQPHFRRQNVAITATLPKSATVMGFKAESAELLRVLFAGVAEHTRPHSTVRLHLGRSHKSVTLSVSLPDIQAADGNLNDTFAFGSKARKRQGQARLALARLLMGHQHGTLSLTLDDEDGVVANLSFLGPKTTAERPK